MNGEKRVLVTGGSGFLGRQLVPRLAEREYRVRVMSRRPAPADTPWEWAQAELAEGTGLAEAVEGVNVIVHLASTAYGQTQEVDVEGTGRLLELAEAAGVEHFVYISIVGIDDFPFAYYRAKLAAEEQIMESNVPWSILRATQFHSFADVILRGLARIPLILAVPDETPVQLVDEGEVAERLAQAVDEGAAGRMPDMAGPEVLTAEGAARSWLAARGMKRWLWPVRFPGRAAAAYRAGQHTNPERAVGRITWEAWLQKQYKEGR